MKKIQSKSEVYDIIVFYFKKHEKGVRNID